MAKKRGRQNAPSSNWFALKKTLTTIETTSYASRKRRKLDPEPNSPTRPQEDADTPLLHVEPPFDRDITGRESLPALRKMIFGQVEHSSDQKMPGKYLALDCEMVGVGVDGLESSLARISIVNFYGAVQLDEFVRQRERVVDYRTHVSGVRETDLIKAKPFNEVQKRVSELLKDRILVGHALHNDLKALLLSHPRSQTRDTQYYAGKYKVTTSRFVALRNLVQQELGVTIQGGEHSSVTDARATMAVFRLHRKKWEKGKNDRDMAIKKGKIRKSDSDTGNVANGGKKGFSSGLSTVVKREGSKSSRKEKWWKVIGESSSKGSMRVPYD